MTYKTLMAHLDACQTNAAVLEVTERLAAQFDAKVIGIAACQPVQIVGSDGYVAGEAMVACRDESEREMREAEATFRASFASSGRPVEWRAAVTNLALSDFISRQARSVDLAVTCVRPAVAFERAKHVSIGDLVMRIGRPVLIVPDHHVARFERIIVAWKDSREARRAASDALPLLKRADYVCVVEIAATDELESATSRVQDVAAWLLTHGVKAIAIAQRAEGGASDQLEAIIAEHKADLVVAGAYGHSRLREWAFGGVTDYLLCGSQLALLSH